MTSKPTGLDHIFLHLLLEIEREAAHATRHVQYVHGQQVGGRSTLARIRVERWAEKLSMVVKNKHWKKNRNLYAALLLHQLQNVRIQP